MPARIILTRKSNGGRSCLLSGKGRSAMTTRRGDKRPVQRKDVSVKESMSSTSMPNENTPLVMMNNRNTPSNTQVQAKKPNMDNFTRKLQNVKVRNISFQL